MRRGRWVMAGLMLGLAGCGGASEPPPADGKAVLPDGPVAETTAIDAASLPEGVRAAVLSRVPDMTIAGATRKARGGMVFYDVEGSRDDGSDIEIDVIEENGAYRVVARSFDVVKDHAAACLARRARDRHVGHARQHRGAHPFGQARGIDRGRLGNRAIGQHRLPVRRRRLGCAAASRQPEHQPRHHPPTTPHHVTPVIACALLSPRRAQVDEAFLIRLFGR